MECTTKRRAALAFLAVSLPFVVAVQGCGGGGGGSGGAGGGQAGTNRARFTYQVNLQGVAATLVMELEVVGTSGVTWGPGVTPDITGVIGTGTYTLYTAGELRSSAAHYVFTGQNQFADFTEPATSDRFRVRWVETQQGLRMIVNPLGPGPVAYDCILVRAEAL